MRDTNVSLLSRKLLLTAKLPLRLMLPQPPACAAYKMLTDNFKMTLSAAFPDQAKFVYSFPQSYLYILFLLQN